MPSREGEARREEGHARRTIRRCTARRHVVLEADRVVHVDTPRASYAAYRRYGSRRLEGLGPVASLIRGSIGSGIGRDDRMIIPDPPKHVYLNIVPAPHEVAVGIDAHDIRLVLVMFFSTLF